MSINETDVNVVMFVSSVQLFMYHNRMSLKIFPYIVYTDASCCVEISETEGSLAVFMLLYSYFHISPFHCILHSADTPTAIHLLLYPYYLAYIEWITKSLRVACSVSNQLKPEKTMNVSYFRFSLPPIFESISLLLESPQALPFVQEQL